MIEDDGANEFLAVRRRYTRGEGYVGGEEGEEQEEQEKEDTSWENLASVTKWISYSMLK